MPQNVLIGFLDQENMGLDTKIAILHELIVEILSIQDFGGGHFEKWRHNLQ